MAAQLRHHAAVFFTPPFFVELALGSGGGQRCLDVLLEHRAADHPAELRRERQEALADLHEGVLRVEIDDDARPLPEAAVLRGRPHDREVPTAVDERGARAIPGAAAAHHPVDRGRASLARRRTDGLGGRRSRRTLKRRNHGDSVPSHMRTVRV